MTRTSIGDARRVPPSDDRRPHLKIASRTAMVSAGIAMVAGVIEAGIIIKKSVWLGIPSRFYLLGAITYGLLFLVGGFLVGLAVSLVFRRANDSALPVAAGVATVLFSVGGMTLNVHYLPAFYAPISLVTDLSLLLASLGVAFLVYRLLSRFILWPRLDLACLGVAVATTLVALGLGWSYGRNADSMEIVSGNSGGIAVESVREDLPNILFVLVDTLRADHLTPYGYPHPTSPWLDELAADGIIFEHAIATSSHTKPSTASIFTSRYPPAHQARRLREALPESSITFVQALRAAGYQTAAFSANGFVSQAFGFGKGFEHFEDKSPSYVTLLSPVKILNRIRRELRRRVFGLHIPLEVLIKGIVNRGRWFLSQPAPIVGGGHEMAVRVTDWLERARLAPFFVYAHFLEPHAPYEPPEPLLSRFEAIHGGRIDNPDIPIYTNGLSPFFPAPPIPDEERNGMLARYDAEIADIDSTLRKMTEQVRSLSGDRDLMIVFTSDHGEEFFDHNAWSHAHSVFSEVLHVPLVIAGAPGIVGGRRIEARVSMIDLAPTLLEMLDLPSVEAFQGRSLLPIISAPETERAERPIFAEIYHGDWSYARTLESGGLKLIETQHGKKEHVFLFDMHNDPNELQNLASQVDEWQLSQLRDQMRALEQESEAMASQSTHSISLDEEMVDQFRALGYIN